MKRFVATVGLAAFGAASLQAQSTPGLTGGMTKPWSISATLRGFYDDNFTTATGNAPKQGAFGFEVSPSFALQWSPSAQTHISAAYVYSFKDYDHTTPGQTERFDQTHAFNVSLDHAFSQRLQLIVGDSFVIGQEPDYLRAGDTLATFQRIPGSNMRNYGSITLKEQFTRLFGVEVGYNNAYYDYADPGVESTAVAPTAQATLNRIENTVHIDSQWTLQPETVAVLGYQYRWVDYTVTDQEIGDITDPVTGVARSVFSNERNYREHYAYVGLNQVFRPDLTASARVGAQFIDFYNDPSGTGNGWGPYAQLTVDWTYAQDSRVELGLSHDISSTDVGGAPNGTTSSFTTSQETTVVYASVNHRITARLRGSIIGQFQNGTFSGGTVNNKSEQDYLVGLNLNYQFTTHLSGELGYNYDKLDSEIGRSFDRNRVYIGVTAGY